MNMGMQAEQGALFTDLEPRSSAKDIYCDMKSTLQTAWKREGYSRKQIRWQNIDFAE
jgi:hypothetical protein